MKKSSAHTLEYILLGLIHQEPSHGYALFERIKDSPELSLIWQVKRSKLYYLLDKLEKNQYLSSTPSKDGAYPERYIYQITDKGKVILEDWLHSPVLSSRFVRLAFMSKLYFVTYQNKEAAEKLISTQIEVCHSWLESLEESLQNLMQDTFITTQVYQFRIGQIKTMISWLENCRESLPEFRKGSLP